MVYNIEHDPEYKSAHVLYHITHRRPCFEEGLNMGLLASRFPRHLYKTIAWEVYLGVHGGDPSSIAPVHYHMISMCLTNASSTHSKDRKDGFRQES